MDSKFQLVACLLPTKEHPCLDVTLGPTQSKVGIIKMAKEKVFLVGQDIYLLFLPLLLHFAQNRDSFRKELHIQKKVVKEEGKTLRKCVSVSDLIFIIRFDYPSLAYIHRVE